MEPINSLVRVSCQAHRTVPRGGSVWLAGWMFVVFVVGRGSEWRGGGEERGSELILVASRVVWFDAVRSFAMFGALPAEEVNPKRK